MMARFIWVLTFQMLCLNVLALEETHRALTVDDILKMEHLGRAELVLSGRLMVY